MTGSAAVAARSDRLDPETLQDRRSALPAGLAALAEAAFLFMPLHVLAVEAGPMSTGPLRRYWQFTVMFILGVVILARLRRFKASLSVVAVAAVLVGVAQGVWWARTDLVGQLGMIVLMLFVGFRVATLALRDWRNPMRDAFGIGAAALLVEMVFAADHPRLKALLPVLVVQFFLAALASRAASVRLARPMSKDVPEAASLKRRWLGATMIALGGLAVLLLASVLLGGEQGGLETLGGLVFRVVGAVFGLFVLLLARLLLGPMSWLVDRFNINLRGLEQVAQGLRAIGQDGPQGGGGSDLMLRLLGLGVLAILALLLVRAIRRHFELLDRRAAETSEVDPPLVSPLGGARPWRRGRRLRREMPADTVRRWYAEALLMLERRGLSRPPSRTPGEYLGDVRATYPECAAEFGALTRAYEEVRYGSRTFTRAALERLEAQRTRLMGALHRARKVGNPAGPADPQMGERGAR